MIRLIVRHDAQSCPVHIVRMNVELGVVDVASILCPRWCAVSRSFGVRPRVVRHRVWIATQALQRKVHDKGLHA